MPPLDAYFHHAGWTAEEIEPGVWRAAFAGQAGATYNVYVLAADEWIHFAVSPLVTVDWTQNHERLPTVLLHLNQDLRLVRLALDADGDVNLLADLPASHTSAALFAETLELLASYADHLAFDLWRLAAHPPD